MPVLASLSKRAKVLTITYLTAYEIVRKMQKQKRQSVKYMLFNVLAAALTSFGVKRSLFAL